MSKLFAIIDIENRHRNQLWCGPRRVDGMEEARLEWRGKRAVLTLVLTDFDIAFESEGCPENDRYDEVRLAAGDRKAVEALNPVCPMLRISPNACDGCPKKPEWARIASFAQARGGK